MRNKGEGREQYQFPAEQLDGEEMDHEGARQMGSHYRHTRLGARRETHVTTEFISLAAE